MSLSPLLIDTYRRYKRGTEKFVQWLGSTARLTGAVDDLFTTPKASGARRGAKKKVKQQPHRKQKSFTLPVSTFVRLAEAVVERGVIIPTSILAILEDVIQSRVTCADWFASELTGAEALANMSSNHGHQHYIDVLQTVLKTLHAGKREVTPDHKSISAPRQDCSEKGQLHNIFEHLDLEEPEESEWLPETHAKPKPQSDKCTYKLEQSVDDISFAAYCFFKDATDIRMFVCRTWREYKKGIITFETAAVTANAAIRVIERINHEFLENFPQFSDHTSIISVLLGSSREPKWDAVDGRNADLPQKDFAYESNGAKLSPSAFTCIHTWALLQTFQHDPLGLLDLDLTSEEDTLVKCLLQIDRVGSNCPCSSKKCIPFNDQVMKAVKKIRVDGKIWTWCVFAIQVFRDIRIELGPLLSVGVESLREYGDWVQDAYDDIIFEHRENPEYLQPIVMMKTMAQDLACSDYIQDACVNRHHEKSLSQFDFGPFFLYRQHPIFCGSLKHQMMVLFQINSCQVATSHFFVVTAAHLYNAAVQTGHLPLKSQWTDMDNFIQRQGEEYVFVGRRPEQTRQFWRRLRLAEGNSILLYSKQHLQHINHSPARSKARRKVQCMSRYAELSIRRRFKNGPILQIKPDFDDIPRMVELLANDFLQRHEVSSGPSSLKSKNARGTQRSVTTIETLDTFKKALKEDELYLHFNMLGLHERCKRLLKLVQDMCIQADPDGYSTANCRCNCSKIIPCTAWLLEDVDDNKDSPMKTPFPRVVRILRAIIECEGNIEVTQAKLDLNLIKRPLSQHDGHHDGLPEAEVVQELPVNSEAMSQCLQLLKECLLRSD